MRIYKRGEFLKLPAGTIYAKGKRWFFDGFNVKGSTIGNDWHSRPIMQIDADDDAEMISRLMEMTEQGASYPMNSDFGRDGCFDPDDLFLVMETDDLVNLRISVEAALYISNILQG